MAEQHAVVRFHSKLQDALARVRVVLAAEKAPCFAADAHHQYQDKFLLAECMTSAAIASQVNCLALLGLGRDRLAWLAEGLAAEGGGRAASLHFRLQEKCDYLRMTTRDVEDPTRRVTSGTLAGAVTNLTSKVVTKVEEHFWNFEATYELYAVRGTGQDPSDKQLLLQRTGQVELKTNSKNAPHPTTRPASVAEVNISWLVKHLDRATLAPRFAIDRERRGCHTPRRNADVDDAHHHFSDFLRWATSVSCHLTRLLQVQPDPTVKIDGSALQVDKAIVPVLPLLELSQREAMDTSGDGAPDAGAAGVLALMSGSGAAGSSVLGVADMNLLLAEEARGLSSARSSLEQAFPSGGVVASGAEAAAIATLRHCEGVCVQWAEAMQYIEDLIRKQLIAAIGKEVTPADFAEYMRFHNRKLFADAFAPAPFCFAIRRSSAHSPEGFLSIEEESVGGDGASIPTPIATLSACTPASEHRMSFALGASTQVTFGGDRHLHAWLSNKFSGQTGARLALVSRARQFSSFIVLVGRITSSTTFDPKYAAIVQNKDELTIPLDLATIPTPKEFKDAIESLSPEQQSFAKAFRSMQLESTLFGVLVIQIKPQLEKVLNLCEDALTKEIKLTQDLMQLFIKYQIPSDLLSYTGDDSGELVGGATPKERLDAVRAHVRAMQELIEQSKAEEIQQRRQEETYKRPISATSSDSARNCSDDEEECCPAMEVDLLDFCAAPAADFCNAAPVAAWRALSKSRSRAAASPPRALRAMEGGGPRERRSSPPPAPAAQMQQQQQQPQEKSEPAAQEPKPQQEQPPEPQQPGGAAQHGARDLTLVPKELDARLEELDAEDMGGVGALRPTIINPGETWTKRSQKVLLAQPTVSCLGSEEQRQERNSAFDLLDALTKSGALPAVHASLHVVVAATHCFDKSVTETVVQDNGNPIEAAERASLAMASVVHRRPAAALRRGAEAAALGGGAPL